MALTQNITLVRRGPQRGNAFGYPAAPSTPIYSGALVGVNAAGQVVRIQDSGIVAFAGVALNGVNNSASSAAGATVTCAFDTFQLNVPGATPANINAKVYATDDNTLTLTAPGSGFAGPVGYLAGIDNGLTYVQVQGH